MATFATEIWTPGLVEKPTHRHPSVASRQSSVASHKAPSRNPSGAAGRPPPAPVSSSNGSVSGASTVSGVADDKGRPPSPSSITFPVPPRRNILYRIFHPGESDGEPVFGRSRRSYGSGSEAESEGEHSDESDTEGFFGRPRRRQNSLTEAMRKVELNDLTRRSVSTKEKPKHRGPSMFKGASDTEGSGSETEPEPAQPKRSTSKSNIFYDLLHGGRKPKSQSAPTSPGINPVAAPLEYSSDDSSKSSDSEVETKVEHSHNLFKDLIMHARQKKHAVAGKAAESHARTAGPPSPGADDKPAMMRSLSENSLTKYGRKEEILGRGANAVVRLCCPADNKEKKLAIKEFRKRRKNETQKEYVKKLVAEFCISSTLHHENVVTTVDLIQDEKRHWCVVMEYCAGGDLFGRIHCGSLKDVIEVNCYFKQLVQGVAYLHSMGVAHRDLKPENLLLDKSGRILKITDFGVSEVFRTPFCSLTRKAKGLCGSGPYIAPEEFETSEYDSELVDVWSIGIIYYVMIYNSIPWKAAVPSDPRYKHFLENKGKFWPLDRLPPGPRRLMYRILEPNPAKRVTIKELLEDEWFKSIPVCHEESPNEGVGHKHVCTASALKR
ncbi:HAL protein kinase [Spizellomyces punctatus DAOM BR117]|uniref:non-specific serine/threonine protein kinase n=1 Tax=Spizellomyces punctatus (strain DAOM BR117) TaxID=645134 RepID=A0A0L0HFG3_SPIPD|nr:HAL protein kinase [Spizellomyces punctatus DAOM BR117]KND00211.1 HAL protein kinase [Spizellomyces punctatus DAOM BR117]|eukprot:XP_016608250.1 HAL protein kinase [Spizellomyces punctatus DAOM BR117]